MSRPAESPPDGPESPDEDIDASAPAPAEEPGRCTRAFDDERRRGYEPL
jgi:hypothetical protein